MWATGRSTNRRIRDGTLCLRLGTHTTIGRPSTRSGTQTGWWPTASDKAMASSATIGRPYYGQTRCQ
jgi:hypothetical protein